MYEPGQRRLARKVDKADYSREDGVTLTLTCGHTNFYPDFPRSPIPPCFSIVCKECSN